MGLGDLTKRGISVLLCDQTGSGGALRLQSQPTRFDMEVPAADANAATARVARRWWRSSSAARLAPSSRAAGGLPAARVLLP